MTRVWLVAALIAGAGLTGCGSADKAALSTAASAALQADADHIDAAARSGNAAVLAVAIAELRSDLAEFQAAGAISAGRAAEITAAAQRIAADLATATPKASPSPSPTPKPTPKPAPQKEEHGKK